MRRTTDKPEVFDTAGRYLAAGLSVIPIRPDGSKAPALKWEQFQRQRPTGADLARWFGNGHAHGVAVVGGTVSGNAQVFDFDVDAARVFPAFCALVEAEAPGLVGRLPQVRTPRNADGRHLAFRTESPPPGNQKLAMGPDPNDAGKLKALIETRGEGGYWLAPGCPAACHPAGRTYDHVAGPPLDQLPTITDAEAEVLYRAARSFDRSEQEETGAAEFGPLLGDASPGAAFNRRGPDWAKLLDGWALDRASGPVRYWRRPGKDKGWSATTGYCVGKDGGDLFAVFSTNAPPFPGPSPGRNCSTHSKFAVYAMLRHGGDFKAAAKDLKRQGYGAKPKPAPEQPPPDGGGQQTAPAENSPQAVIRLYWMKRYAFTHKEGTALWSDAEGREVKAGELLSGASSQLLAQLTEADGADVHCKGEVAVAKMPAFFKKWAPTALQDLLLDLRAEADADEYSEQKAGEFCRQVRAALVGHVTIGEIVNDQGEDGTHTERAPLIDFAQRFAPSNGKRWGDVRGYRLWSKVDGGSLRVVLMADLFHQLRSPLAAKFGDKKIAILGRRYGVFTEDLVKIGGGVARALELTPAFLNQVLRPVDNAKEPAA